MLNLDKITEREKDLLLTHFFHHLSHRPHDLQGANCRHVIGSEFPGIYNRLMGREIVTVEWPHDREQRGAAA